MRSLPPEGLASAAVVQAAAVERLAAMLPPAAADGLEPALTAAAV